MAAGWCRVCREADDKEGCLSGATVARLNIILWPGRCCGPGGPCCECSWRAALDEGDERDGEGDGKDEGSDEDGDGDGDEAEGWRGSKSMSTSSSSSEEASSGVSTVWELRLPGDSLPQSMSSRSPGLDEMKGPSS